MIFSADRPSHSTLSCNVASLNRRPASVSSLFSSPSSSYLPPLVLHRTAPDLPLARFASSLSHVPYGQHGRLHCLAAFVLVHAVARFFGPSMTPSSDLASFALPARTMEGNGHARSPRGTTKADERPRLNGTRFKREGTSASDTPNGSKMNSRAASPSPEGAKSASDSASTPDNAAAPKSSRKAAQKAARSPPPLFDQLPDVTEESCSTFQVINDCLYGAKNMGSSEHDALDCDCAEEWRK